jgi:hypothetical protein
VPRGSVGRVVQKRCQQPAPRAAGTPALASAAGSRRVAETANAVNDQKLQQRMATADRRAGVQEQLERMHMEEAEKGHSTHATIMSHLWTLGVYPHRGNPPAWIGVCQVA